jgi:hypothetical protein
MYLMIRPSFCPLFYREPMYRFDPATRRGCFWEAFAKDLATRVQAPTHKEECGTARSGPALYEKAFCLLEAVWPLLFFVVQLREPTEGEYTGGARNFLAASFSAGPQGPVDLARWSTLSCCLWFGVGRRSGELRGGVLRPATAEDVWLSDRYRREVCPVRESGDLPTAVWCEVGTPWGRVQCSRSEIPSPHAQVRWLFTFQVVLRVSVTVGLSVLDLIRLRREID